METTDVERAARPVAGHEVREEELLVSRRRANQPRANQPRPAGAAGTPPTRPAATAPAPRRPAPRPAAARAARRPPLLAIGAVAVVAVAVVAGLILLTGRDQTYTGVTGAGQSKGPDDAAVVLYEYADYQCPACADAFLKAMKEVDSTFVSTGKIRVEFRHMAILGQESVVAAQAASCAADQGRFWEYSDLLFRNQAGRDTGAFAPDRLKSFASRLSLDQATFDSCLDSGKYQAKVIADREEGRKAGVTATPTFIVGDQRLVGAESFSAFRQMIEAALAKVQ